jgi:Zn-dependent protease with chaperone function
MSLLYPSNPASIPQDLTKPSSAYKNRAWLAMGGLALFLAIYLGFTAWFAWTAYRMFSGISQGGDFNLAGAAAGAVAAFLFIFMVKALFAVKHSNVSTDMEITKQQQPQLFEFLYRLADDAGAPRPHKVYLSPQVNAAVFYDLSLLNLFFPSKKNLLIGLGLVNVLNLGELKAVLAHEFGHFAQKSMAVGRWVYIAQQIASQIVAKRDWLDSLLQGISNIDLRIAWIGWTLRLIVWSIRSLLDTVFSLVVLSERALSRQMEFQADLVAVSLTGSNALVHALNKLGAGDDAWSKTLNFVNMEINEGRKVADIFAIQTRMLEKLRDIYHDNDYGAVPEIPQESPEKHRVFKSKIALPPQMWSTHPENTAREENAKRCYIPCAIDTRSAWDIFNHSDQVKRDLSQHLLLNVKKELTEVPIEESLSHLEKFYDKPWLNSEYRGAYLGRSIVRHTDSVDQLFIELTEVSKDSFKDLYPESLTHQLESLRDLHEEKNMLEALRDKMLKASGLIQFRGETIKQKDLPKCIQQVTDEINQLEKSVVERDRHIRSVHLAAAAHLGNGWREYLVGLLSVLHYVDHADADLADATALVSNVWAIITADGSVSNSERSRLVDAVYAVHRIMSDLHNHSAELQLDQSIVDKWNFSGLDKALGEYKLPSPSAENIGEWLKIYDGWTSAFRRALSDLKYATLELLLVSEKKIADAYQQQQELEIAPSPSKVPSQYVTLLPGKERKKQKKLGLWDSFITATGLVPAVSRFAVAASIVGAVFWFGQSLGSMDLIVYNGLAQTVKVDINGLTNAIQPFKSKTISVSSDEELHIVTTTDKGELIEEFSQPTGPSSFQHAIYNIAAASPLIKWWAAYGNASQRESVPLGTKKWLTETASYYFSEPPESIQMSSKSGGESRSVITGYGNVSPIRQLGLLNNEQEKSNLIAVHVRWDNLNSAQIAFWLELLRNHDNGIEILRSRLAKHPESTLLMRMEQDLTTGDEHDAVCAKHAAAAKSSPENSDFAYLSVRCLSDGEAQDNAFLAGREKWPSSPWFAMTSAYIFAGQEKWDRAVNAYALAIKEYSPLALYVSDNLARLQRVTMFESVGMNNLAKVNDQLNYNLSVEEGSLFEGSPDYAYYLLGRGKLTNAMSVAKDDPYVYARILPLVAASTGTTSEWIQTALSSVDKNNLDESIAWVMMALATREGHSTDIYKQYLSTLNLEYSENLMQFLSQLNAPRKDVKIENYLANLQPQARGYAYTMAVIFLREKCPEKWKDLASKLLFTTERPFIR